MTTINFPNSPSIGDQYAFSGKIWQWDGTGWFAVRVPGGTGATGSAGNDGIDGQVGANGQTGQTGNTGSTGSGGSTGPTGTAVDVTTSPGTDLTATGITVTLTAGESVVFGDICYFKSDGDVWKANATDNTKVVGLVMALETLSSSTAGSFLLIGIARDDSWSWTVGGIVYLSTTSGLCTQTQPAATGNVIQVLGVATAATRILFKPSSDYITHT